ncbi:DUF3891 family protein [Cohnella sp. CFH 77786]|uniref:DUF3891 family protein n=1 Tax=Cohnella sp. CFH 77786 TaxID=2662265 RepID=UPI001C60DC55|nr:DUF3891 family protein [Cohnella sp. CFH 77786]MBW5444455.1 DUF3891 family protein [Cohnella sp. CFH 77786]
MIVRETDDDFLMVTQHDHARLSGDVAKHFADHYFVDDTYFSDVLTAIYEHDRGWIRLDDVPLWNDRSSFPFTFMDYPLVPKLAHYKLGIDEVQEMNEYAALLCSIHYCSFMTSATADQTDIVRFLELERERQKQIKHRIAMPTDEVVRRHFGLLQLCDDISLYVCLNKPGATKSEEHPWYAGGFGKSETLVPAGLAKLVASWVSQKEIRMGPWPFKGSFMAKLQQKRVSKSLIRQVGLQEAYSETNWTEQEIEFIGEQV